MRKPFAARFWPFFQSCVAAGAPLAFAFACLLCDGCQKPTRKPAIEFTVIPEAHEGGPGAMTKIAGRVKGALPDDKIVLFAKSGQWWIQPLTDHPFTPIEADSTWRNSTHFGYEYAALLVSPGYRPLPIMESLPNTGDLIKAVASVKGIPGTSVIKTIHFSGYDWSVRSASSDRGGGTTLYDPDNAWTDESGALHLRIKMASGKWNGAEVNLVRSLGYGTYRFTARDTSLLEPAAVLSMFAWDDSNAEQNHREFDIELTRWGDPKNQNAQFVVQPYYLPANVARFMTARGPVTYSVNWAPGKLSFAAIQESGTSTPRVISEHTFTSGLPTPGSETIHLDLYTFTSSPVPLKNQTEAVIEKFAYLP